MRRIYPRYIQDKNLLARLLDQYLHALQSAPLGVGLAELAFDTRIPAAVFSRLRQLGVQSEAEEDITVEDYHILFANLLFRYPTVKIWLQADGQVFIER